MMRWPISLVLLTLAYLGIQGQRAARRQAELEDIIYCRDNLEEAMDSRRSSAGPRPKQSAADPQSSLRAVTEWAARLKKRVVEFRSAYAPREGAEDLEVGLSAAALAIAEGRFAEAVSSLDAIAESRAKTAVQGRDRRTDILRLRADAYHDRADWTSALGYYRQLLEVEPQSLSAAERVAACLHSLQESDAAVQAYTDLAARLQDRGSRLLAQLNHSGAARDLNKAATLRHWLVEQGRHELTGDLSRSFSSCAAALAELQQLKLADAYAANAIDIQAQLVDKKYRADLAAELAESNALRARILLDLGNAGQALGHLGSAIELGSRLIHEGKTQLQRGLAVNLGQRGLVLRAQGQSAPAGQDFARAAEAFAGLGDLRQAVLWQSRALEIAAPGSRDEIRLRLDDYRQRSLQHDLKDGR